MDGGGGWKTVGGKPNARAEKKARKGVMGGMHNATGAFAELEEFRKQEVEDKRIRQEEAAELREQRREEEEAKKQAAADRKHRRELAEKQRRAKDPRCWSVLSEVLIQNKAAMLKDMRALVDDDLANSSVAMKVQYVFTTFDKHCRSSTLPISEGIERYFEPLRSVQDTDLAYSYLKASLDPHYTADSVCTEDYLVAASTTFGGRGTTTYDNKNPVGLGLLLAFQYLVELNPTAALSAFPAILRSIFISDKTAEFYTPVGFNNASSILCLALQAPPTDHGFHTVALTSFLAHCYVARVKVPTELLDYFVSVCPSGEKDLGDGDAIVTDTTAALTYLLRCADKGISTKTLVGLMNVVSATAHKNKAYRNSFLPMLKEVGQASSQPESQHYLLALHLCKQFVLEDDAAGKTQSVWAESIATHVVETTALLQAIKAVGGALTPSFMVKATARLNAAQQRSKNPEAFNAALACLGSTKTGTSNAQLAQARKSGVTAPAAAPAASKREATGSSFDDGNTVLQTLFGIVVIGFAFAAAFQTK